MKVTVTINILMSAYDESRVGKDVIDLIGPLKVIVESPAMLNGDRQLHSNHLPGRLENYHIFERHGQISFA